MHCRNTNLHHTGAFDTCIFDVSNYVRLIVKCSVARQHRCRRFDDSQRSEKNLSDPSATRTNIGTVFDSNPFSAQPTFDSITRRRPGCVFAPVDKIHRPLLSRLFLHPDSSRLISRDLKAPIWLVREFIIIL